MFAWIIQKLFNIHIVLGRAVVSAKTLYVTVTDSRVQAVDATLSTPPNQIILATQRLIDTDALRFAITNQVAGSFRITTTIDPAADLPFFYCIITRG